jgi:hypothetical protein
MVKINFRKVASVLTSAVMLSSTIGIAAAANYPAPFVKSGNADVAVVWGSSAQASDLVAVTDITADLQAELASQTATSGSSEGSSTVSGGDFVKLERSTDKFNLGESTNDFYSSLDSDELSAVLADGIYENDANDEFDFTQKIVLGELNLTHFQDDDLSEEPRIGFDIADGTEVLNYTLDFTPDAAEGGANFDDLETTDLTLLGRSYYVVQAQNVSNKPKLTLLDSANSAIVTEGESSTVSVGDSSYDVSIDFIDSDEVILTIDGTTTNKLSEGDVFKLADNTYVAVKNILYSAKDAGVSKAEISIGSGKIVLQDGQEVTINNEDVSDIDKYNDATLTSHITMANGGDIDKIVLTWATGDDEWLVPGRDLVLPGFETIKVSMGGFNVPTKEVTMLENDGEDSIKLDTSVEDGDVSFNLVYNNDTQILGYGKSATKRLVTSSNASINLDKDTDDWFVASWVNGDDAESYVLEISDITDTDATKNTTTLKSVASGSNLAKELDIAEAEDFGRVRLTLVSASEQSGAITVGLSAAGGSGTVSFNRLYTKEGLRVQLPVNTTNSGNAGNLNLSANPASFIVQFTEEDEDGTIGSGDSFNVTLGLNSDGEAQVSTVGTSTLSGTSTFETDDGSNTFVGYVESPLASMITFDTDGDQDTVEVEYHGEESFADVFVSEAGAVISSDGTTTTTSSGTVKRLGSVAVSDAEASSVSTKNLIVVGGSCVNSVAADLLGGALCGANFESKTGAGSGQFVIETFARSGGKVATLVAGYNAADTTNAAKYLTTQTVDTAAGKRYVGTSATSAQLVTTASNSSA